MGLFSKKPNAEKLLDEALACYRNEDYATCYDKVCTAADTGNARANFCKALLIYNDNVSDSPVDVDELKALTKKAVDGGYPLAYGFYAYVLHATGDLDGLCAFLAQKSKVKDGVYLSFKASYYLGIYTDEEQADYNTTIATARESLKLLETLDEQIKSGKNTQALEYYFYNPYNKFKINYTYSHANYTAMTILYCANDWSARKEFMSTYNKVIEYMPIADERYRAASLYMKAVLDNYLGMQDLKEANRAMGILSKCFDQLDEEEVEEHRDEYNELYDQYDAFYDSESENIRNRDVSYTDGYVDKNDISFKNVVSAISSSVQQWANSPSEESRTTTVYTINGREYTRGDMGYLYDNNGYRSSMRIDDYSRLYDEDDNELGYFNVNGNFISK